MSRWLASMVFLFAIAFFGAFLVWPVAQIVQGGFVDTDGHFTLAHLAAVLAHPLYRAGLLNSLLLACLTTTLAIALGLPLAFCAERFRFLGKTALTALILVPLVMPPFVGAIGLRQIFGQYGALNALLWHLGVLADGHTIDWLAHGRFWGVALAEALNLYPIIFLNAVAALANVDPAMEEAAANLGCTGLRRFRRVTLPLIRPGLFAGGTIVFIWSFTELGVPLVFDYDRVAPFQLFALLKEMTGNPAPYALVALMLLSSVTLYAVGRGLFGRAGHAMMARATSTFVARRLTWWRSALVTGLFAGVLCFAVLPHVGVVLVACSRDWYAALLPEHFTLENFRLALGHELTVSSIGNSLRYAGLATVLDLVLGVAIAWVVVRSKLPGRNILDSLAMLPLAVPGLVLAFGYLAMTREGRAFAALDPVENPTLLLVIAYGVRRLPYVVRAAAAGFQQTHLALEEAAQNLGATAWRTLRRVTLPLIAANLIAGGLMAFAFAMLEVSDSIILAQKPTYFPITKAIYELFQLLGDGRYLASALGTWAMAFLALTIATLGVLLGKKAGTLFRG
ncbi:MAG: iron ABC transporter permease [Opitutaceae bacterium]